MAKPIKETPVLLGKDAELFIKENKELEVDGITSPELKHFFNSSELEKGFFDYINDEDFKEFLLDSQLFKNRFDYEIC